MTANTLRINEPIPLNYEEIKLIDNNIKNLILYNKNKIENLEALVKLYLFAPLIDYKTGVEFLNNQSFDQDRLIMNAVKKLKKSNADILNPRGTCYSAINVEDGDNNWKICLLSYDESTNQLIFYNFVKHNYQYITLCSNHPSCLENLKTATRIFFALSEFDAISEYYKIDHWDLDLVRDEIGRHIINMNEDLTMITGECIPIFLGKETYYYYKSQENVLYKDYYPFQFINWSNYVELLENNTKDRKIIEYYRQKLISHIEKSFPAIREILPPDMSINELFTFIGIIEKDISIPEQTMIEFGKPSIIGRIPYAQITSELFDEKSYVNRNKGIITKIKPKSYYFELNDHRYTNKEELFKIIRNYNNFNINIVIETDVGEIGLSVSSYDYIIDSENLYKAVENYINLIEDTIKMNIGKEVPLIARKGWVFAVLKNHEKQLSIVFNPYSQFPLAFFTTAFVNNILRDK